MSAFIASKETYSNVYSGLSIYGYSQLAPYIPIKRVWDRMTASHRSLEDIIRDFYRVNVRAVNERYDEKTSGEITEKIGRYMVLQKVSLFQFLKSLECLHYQMSEGVVPKEEQAYKDIEDLINAVSYVITHNNPSYELASWN
jgi:hypothetical protein